MKNYKVTTPRETYTVEAKNKEKARKEILERENITLTSEVCNETLQPDSTLGDFIFLEQDDPKWEDVTIGQTEYTLGTWGCTITALSMLTYWYGDYKTPDWIAKNLRFNHRGEIYWASMNGKLPMNFVKRSYYKDTSKLKQIINSEDNACVIRVPYGKYSHWLTAVGFDENGIIAADPMNKTRVYAENNYGKINGFTEVTRA